MTPGISAASAPLPALRVHEFGTAMHQTDTPTTDYIGAGPPAAPQTPSAIPGNASAAVSWSPPNDDGGSMITGSVVTPYLNGVAQSPQTFMSTATTETVTGLTNANSYTFDVAAINANGTGLRSALSDPIVVGTPLPPAPVTATAGSLSALVSWTAPAVDNGSPVTGYVVYTYIPGSYYAVKGTIVGTQSTSTTVTGLTAGQSYLFRVAATNANGTGPFAGTPKPNITIGA